MVEVSAAKRNITPPFPMYMRGYAMRTGKSIGVLDELYCRTLVLRIDGEIFIWSTLDLCRLEEPISDYARTVLAGKYSVPKENIIIGTIHTHSGPDISFEDEGEDRNHRKAVYRELTKRYEEKMQTTLGDSLSYYEQNEPRGEYVLVLQGKSFEEIAEEEKKNWESMTLEEHMQVYESQGIARKEAMKLVAKDRGISKRDVYQALLS